MNTRALLSIGIVYLLVGCADQTSIHKRFPQRDLVGHVKSVKETSYQAIEQSGKLRKGEKKREEHMDSFVLYNRKGQPLEETLYEFDGRVWLKTITCYTRQGRPTSTHIYESDGSLHERWTSTYNEKDRTIELNRDLVYKGQRHRTFAQLDKEGKLLEETTYDAHGHVHSRCMYVYDANGKPLERKYYDADDAVTRRAMYTYTTSGKFSECSVYRSDGSLDQLLTYDENGNILVFKWYDSENTLVYKETSHYDARGNRTEQQQYRPEGSLEVMYHYTFDDQGNWITRIEFQDNAPRYIVERQIEYYE